MGMPDPGMETTYILEVLSLQESTSCRYHFKDLGFAIEIKKQANTLLFENIMFLWQYNYFKIPVNSYASTCLWTLISKKQWGCFENMIQLPPRRLFLKAVDLVAGLSWMSQDISKKPCQGPKVSFIFQEF